MKSGFSIAAILLCLVTFGQTHTKKALFLGNSYTAVNNLPQMVADVALSNGDTLIFDSNTTGGCTLEGHSSNVISLNKIKSGNWDFVVLQEQSQRPSLPIEQVLVEVFPYAKILDSIIQEYNPCCETVFYMTWGRKNGDASNCDIWPPVCTYEGMDSLLNLRYRMLADSNQAILSPVGAVWHDVRDHYPLIELYQSDESHPSVAGSYAAACSFYTAFFRKNPEQITFNPSLAPVDADNIRTAAKLVVFDSLINWHIGEYDPKAEFSYEENGTFQVSFINTSEYASDYFWDFGDGETSVDENPVHTFLVPGIYDVKLKAIHCQLQDSVVHTVDLSLTGVNCDREKQKISWKIYPLPATSVLTIEKLSPGNIHYKIYNSNGLEIDRGTIANSENKISIASLPAGLYILQLYRETISLGVKRFIKE
jgi:hypothetical protein